MPETNDDEFTFTIEDNEYIIKKNDSSKNKQCKNLIHGPSIIIGASITAVCVLGIFFALNIATSEDQQLIEIQISEEKAKLEHNIQVALGSGGIDLEDETDGSLLLNGTDSSSTDAGGRFRFELATDDNITINYPAV